MYSFITDGNYIIFRYTEDNYPIAAGRNDVYTEDRFRLHNTSTCIDWALPSDTTKVTFTIDEQRYENVLLSSIDFDGDVCGVQADFVSGVQAMFSNLAPGEGGGGGLGYSVYVALLAQTGTNAPVATVLQNTLGGTPVWTRPTSAGSYSMTLNGAFPVNKVYCGGFDLAVGLVTMPISMSTMADFYYAVYRQSDNVIQVFFYDNTYTGVDMSETGLTQLSLPEIRVYP